MQGISCWLLLRKTIANNMCGANHGPNGYMKGVCLDGERMHAIKSKPKLCQGLTSLKYIRLRPQDPRSPLQPTHKMTILIILATQLTIHVCTCRMQRRTKQEQVSTFWGSKPCHPVVDRPCFSVKRISTRAVGRFSSATMQCNNFHTAATSSVSQQSAAYDEEASPSLHDHTR